jgi:hypothetical protein
VHDDDTTPPTYAERYEAALRKIEARAYGAELSRVTEAQKQELLMFQGFVCAICEKSTDLVLDHSHSTLLVRGWLCQGCNARLGQYRDSQSLLRSRGYDKCARYLRRPPAKRLGIEASYAKDGITMESRRRAVWTAAVLESLGWGD